MPEDTEVREGTSGERSFEAEQEPEQLGLALAQREADLAELREALARQAQELADAQETLARREAEATDYKKALEERDAEAGRLQEQLGLALERYREALLASAPEVPGELIQGETVQEVEASLERARSLVERVRSQVEAHMSAERMPAGAPVRSGPDLSRLSPQEKIAYALSRERR